MDTYGASFCCFASCAYSIMLVHTLRSLVTFSAHYYILSLTVSTALIPGFWPHVFLQNSCICTLNQLSPQIQLPFPTNVPLFLVDPLSYAPCSYFSCPVSCLHPLPKHWSCRVSVSHRSCLHLWGFLTVSVAYVISTHCLHLHAWTPFTNVHGLLHVCCLPPAQWEHNVTDVQLVFTSLISLENDTAPVFFLSPNVSYTIPNTLLQLWYILC